jgi:phage terminase small subunit
MLSSPAGIIDLSDPKKPRVKLPHELDAATAAAISSFEIDDMGRIKYRFWDKNSSLERAAKILGAFKEDNRQKNPITALLGQLSGNVLKPKPEGAEFDGNGDPDD